MIKGDNCGQVPDKFLLIFDADTSIQANIIRRLIDKTKVSTAEYYNIGIYEFCNILNRNSLSYGVFEENMAVGSGCIKGSRYWISHHGEKYNDEWFMSCAGYSILVFSNSGDLIIDVAKELGHSIIEHKEKREKIIPELIVSAIKQYTNTDYVDLDDIIM